MVFCRADVQHQPSAGLPSRIRINHKRNPMFFKQELAGLFIAAPEEAKSQIVYKWPNNSIRKLSGLIVDADQSALFIARGVVVGSFGPGRYKLDAAEWPFLGTIIDAATNGNAYRAEIFFVSTKQFPNEKFGSKVDNVVDPRTGLVVSLLMHGEYAVRAVVAEKLILNLVGTGVAEDSGLLDWVDQQLIKSLRKFVTTNVVSGSWQVLGLAGYTDEIESAGLSAVNSELEEYGLTIVKFGNVEIGLSPDDEAQIKKLSKDTAYSVLAGSFGGYAAGAALLGAGAGMEKGGGSPALLAAGLGIGGGLGGFLAANQTVPVPAVAAQTAPAEAAPVVAAPVLPATTASGSKFCSECGSALLAGAKFCPECGTAVGGTL
jgi:membrane protease subunit (stomatin/prohibitin family)